MADLDIPDTLKRLLGSIIIATTGFFLFALAGRLALIEGSWLYGISALIYFIPISLFLIFITFILVKLFDEYDDDIYKYTHLATILLSYIASGFMFEQNPTLTQRVDTYLASIHSNQQSASHLVSLTELSKQQLQLWKASRQGDLNKITLAIRDGVDPDFAYDGSSPLMNSIEYGHYNAVEFLLLNGADVNKALDYYYSPLGASLIYEYDYNGFQTLVILNLLIKAGVDLNIADEEGKSNLIFLIENDNYDEYLKVIRVFIKAGADVNLQDNVGMTALMYAAKLDANTSILYELLDADADINLKDNNGKTAYRHALDASNVEVSKIIRAGKTIHKIKLLNSSDFEN